jgi:hypothetical protein
MGRPRFRHRRGILQFEKEVIPMKQRHIQTFLMVSAAFFAMSATTVNAAEGVPGGYAGANASPASLAIAAVQAQRNDREATGVVQSDGPRLRAE